MKRSQSPPPEPTTAMVTTLPADQHHLKQRKTACRLLADAVRTNPMKDARTEAAKMTKLEPDHGFRLFDVDLNSYKHFFIYV
jgi:hypothetical protein